MRSSSNAHPEYIGLAASSDETPHGSSIRAIAHEIAAMVQVELKARAARAQLFSPGLFSDPAWDILLDLFAAEIAGTRLHVSVVAVAADVRPTTVLRWLAALEAKGLITRRSDPLDKRRTFIGLTYEGSRLMGHYFERRINLGVRHGTGNVR